MLTVVRFATFSILASNFFGQNAPNHLEPIRPWAWSTGLGQAVTNTPNRPTFKTSKQGCGIAHRTYQPS